MGWREHRNFERQGVAILSDVAIAILTSGLAVAGAVVVYALERVMLEPAIELRRVIGRVDFALTHYAREIANPSAGENVMPAMAPIEQVSTELRETASSLRVAISSVVWYPATALIARLPQRKECMAAFKELTGLSNSVHRDDGRSNDDIRRSILRRLGLLER